MVQVSSGAWVLITGALLGGVILTLPRIKAEIVDVTTEDKDAVVSDWDDWGRCKWKKKAGIFNIGGFKKCRTRVILEDATGDGTTPKLKECKGCTKSKLNPFDAEINSPQSYISEFF